MKRSAFFKHLINIFDQTIPDEGFDRDYFETISNQQSTQQSQEEDTRQAPSNYLDIMPATPNLQHQPASSEPAQEEQPQYLYTLRGVKMPINQAAKSKELQKQTVAEQHPQQNQLANSLDLSNHQSAKPDLSPHVLDLGS